MPLRKTNLDADVSVVNEVSREHYESEHHSMATLQVTNKHEPDDFDSKQSSVDSSSGEDEESLDHKKEDEYQGGFKFDGSMHLKSLYNQQGMDYKVFSCRKDAFVQIVSGLKDPNVVLTVNLKMSEKPAKAKLKHTTDKEMALYEKFRSRESNK